MNSLCGTCEWRRPRPVGRRVPRGLAPHSQDKHRLLPHSGQMSEQPPGNGPDPEYPTQSLPEHQAAAAEEAGTTGSSRPRRGFRERYDALRERTWSFRSVVAVALATLIVGGLGGAAIGALVDDDHDDRRQGRFERADDRRGWQGRDGRERRGPGQWGRRGQGQGQWGRDGSPGDQQQAPPSVTPSPSPPESTG